MKNMSKFLRSTAIIVLSAIMSIMVVPSTSLAHADTTASTQLSEQDIVKMSEAINMSTDSEVYDIGTNPYRIFDVNNADFAKLFISSSVPDYKNYSFSASNRSDLSSEYSKERAFGSGLNVNVPIYNVSANIDTNFQTNISSSLQTVNDEYYEYFERYQQTRVITTDWLSRDLTPYFSSTFIADYNNINSLKSARAFLEKYGTHVFDKYYMGGSLIITNYIASEVNIAKEYESNNKSIGLGTQIANAVSANSNGSDMQIEGNNVSNEQTKSQMKMRARGGMNFNALTVNDLFTYKQEYFTGGGSGYVYVDWIKSFDSKQNEVVIDAENPVAVWDLLDKTSYFDATKDTYLQQAFEIMCYGNYSELCNENGINSDIIGEVEYKANNATVKFSITNQSIKLPSGVDVKFNFGNTVLNNENIKDAKIAFDKNYEYATISGNTLNIASAAAGKSIAVFVKIHDENIYKLNIAVTDNQSVYANGYGTKDQPYLVSTPEQWKSFMSYSQNSVKTYYQLANDIDLQGKHFEVGGSSDRASFNGELDGNGHTLSNFSVVAKSEWQNIGLFGSNVGIIKNLTIENAKCMNSGIISATNAEINAGILVGENQGKIENIILKNSSVRITGELKNSAVLNLGVACGTTFGSIDSVGVSKCNVYAQSWKGEGVINVGGVAGTVKVSNMTRCYVNNSKINAYNQKSDSATYVLGGLVGYVHSTDDATSKINYCISSNNTFNTTSGKFGYVAGNSVANNSFANCYYASTTEKSVNGKSMNGCVFMREMSLGNIGDAEFNKYWTTDLDGNVILKAHAEVR